MVVITNAYDDAVNNEMTARVVKDWRRETESKVRTFEFPASQRLLHDFIDPGMPKQQTQTLYPALLDLIANSPTETTGSR